MRTESPLDALRRLAADTASGELICAIGVVEVHVYLQRGRVAWATDSEHPFAFTRYLQKAGQIDADSFRDILESCRREKRLLGETLVSWGLVTWEEVRDALRHQIGLALDVLRRGGQGQTLFLDRTRQFAEYDSSLTFDLAQLVPADEPAPSTQAPGSDVGPGSASPAQYARRLFDAVEGVLWVELLDGTTAIDAAPEPSPCVRVPSPVVGRTTLDGSDLVAIRSPEGTLAGVALDGPRSLWCRLSADVPVGAAISALAAFGETERRAERQSGGGERWATSAETEAARALHEFLSRAPETIAAIVTTPDDPVWSCGEGCGALTLDATLDLVRRRASVLATPIADGTASPDEGVGFRFRSMMSVERRVLCFAAELSTTPRRIVWLLLARSASQGLGWAYLTSLSRQLVHVRGWGHG